VSTLYLHQAYPTPKKPAPVICEIEEGSDGAHYVIKAKVTVHREGDRARVRSTKEPLKEHEKYEMLIEILSQWLADAIVLCRPKVTPEFITRWAAEFHTDNVQSRQQALRTMLAEIGVRVERSDG
jgi:hypothetical protein